MNSLSMVSMNGRKSSCLQIVRNARDCLDRVPRSDPGYAMAVFKRAQVSVLLHEQDAPARIEAARKHADSTTRELIARERLFAQ